MNKSGWLQGFIKEIGKQGGACEVLEGTCKKSGIAAFFL
jgi:hypothetical protein